jgi:hypothetical protein
MNPQAVPLETIMADLEIVMIVAELPLQSTLIVMFRAKKQPALLS